MTSENQFSVADSRVVVIGAARSGVAAAELLVKRGARVVLSEALCHVDGLSQLQAAGVGIEVGGHRPETLASADLVVLSPGVSPSLPVIDQIRRRGTPVISEVELAARWLRGRIVAVTGTKGKSTTTLLTARMLDADGRKVVVGGNVGTALSSQVEASTPEVIHVVEVSSFQLELTETFRPWIAVFLNLSPDHLDRHETFEEYAAAKARIFANQTSSDAMVINADDPLVLELARHGRARTVHFTVASTVEDGVMVSGDSVTYRSSRGAETLMPLSAVRLPGRHLLSDVLAASAVSSVIGVSSDAMCRAVESFDGLEHTLESIGEINGVCFVNDSKATNITAARASIECFTRDLVVILGGRFKGGELADLIPLLSSRDGSVVAIGEARDRIREVLGRTIQVKEAQTMRDAVHSAFALARSRGTVLLAPACASLDMFEDYADRGRVFKEEVALLAQEVSNR